MAIVVMVSPLQIVWVVGVAEAVGVGFIVTETMDDAVHPKLLVCVTT